MKRIIGISMLVTLFTGIFSFIAYKDSAVKAFTVFGIVSALLLFVTVAVNLIFSKGEDEFYDECK